MFLKRGIFVNWGNIPQLEFEFGPVNLFSGGNGSGKTTAADAIQTLMTAAHENLFNYNPGQDETTQKGRGGKQVRTLASYVLGCDDGAYARPYVCDGYIAGIFHPTQGEAGEPFTAVICMRAQLDAAGKPRQARLVDSAFLILPGEQLSLSHFVRSYPDGKHIVPLNDIANLLRKEFGSKAVEIYDKKGAYLRRLYGAVRGRRDAVSDKEAKHAARTLSNFMAYKPVKSITGFVAQEILKPIDLGDAIRNVSELMKTIHQMESDTRDILQSIETLAVSEQWVVQYRDRWQELKILQHTECLRKARENQKNYLGCKKRQQDIASQLVENEQAQAICNERRDQTHAQIVALEAQRQGISALRDKDALERQLRQLDGALKASTRPLIEQTEILARNHQAAQSLVRAQSDSAVALAVPPLADKSARDLLKRVIEDAAEPDVNQWLSPDWIDNTQLETSLDAVVKAEATQNRWHQLLYSGNSESAHNRLLQAVTAAAKNRQDTETRLKQKLREIQQLESHRSSYPGFVDSALAAIRAQCPQANPQVLCDYIEVTDPSWQMAIEGYVGGARFSILVEQEFEAEAIRAVREMRDARRNRARVVQGEKARRDAARLNLPRDSIVDVMTFEHKTAEYFIKASYGNVLRVRDAEQLKTTARGITPEGLGSGNYAMFRCDLDDSELVFGQGARERALQAKQAQAQQLADQASAAAEEHSALARALELVDQVRPAGCVQQLQNLLNLHREIHQARTALEQLDLSDFKELEENLRKQQQSFAGLEQQQRDLLEQAGRLKEQEKQADKSVKSYADAADIFSQALDDAERDVQSISGWQPDFDADAALAESEQTAQSAGDDFNFTEQVHDCANALDRAEVELNKTLLVHNQHCQKHDTVFFDTGMAERHSIEYFQAVLRVKSQIGLIHNRLKNNVLVDKYEKLKSLKDHFNTAFVANLCHSIYQAIAEGERTLKELNSELEHHRFGADRERFRFDVEWVPEFREYWRFFKEVIDLPDLGEGAGLFEAELSASSSAVRDKLLAMLLDNDEASAMRELTRISDYRNYRHYEIYKEPEGKEPIALSQYGTGSGGQLETPAYIIRSAAVTSAFRFNEGSTHLRMVLVDEAFSKMDETRSREVIHYLTERLGLQLIFIMPTSKSGPFMDLISNQFVFSKCPTQTPVGELNTRVLVDRKQCNQENIKALWANHRRVVRHQGMLDFMENI